MQTRLVKGALLRLACKQLPQQRLEELREMCQVLEAARSFNFAIGTLESSRSGWHLRVNLQLERFGQREVPLNMASCLKCTHTPPKIILKGAETYDWARLVRAVVLGDRGSKNWFYNRGDQLRCCRSTQVELESLGGSKRICCVQRLPGTGFHCLAEWVQRMSNARSFQVLPSWEGVICT